MFEKVILKDNAKSRTYLNQLKEELSNISSDESNDMFTRIGPALKHICSATNAYLMSLTSDLQLEETAKKVRRIPLFVSYFNFLQSYRIDSGEAQVIIIYFGNVWDVRTLFLQCVFLKYCL